MKEFIIDVWLCGLDLSAFPCNKQDKKEQNDIVETNSAEGRELGENTIFLTCQMNDMMIILTEFVRK